VNAALTMFYALENFVNPFLVRCNIAPVSARIGIDLGPLLIARVGTPKGTSKQERNFLTAVGPCANLACHIQEMAGTDEIWIGDLVRRSTYAHRQEYCINVTPSDWGWNYTGFPYETYSIWRYTGRWKPPI
jgi:adenylate cyclase